MPWTGPKTATMTPFRTLTSPGFTMLISGRANQSPQKAWCLRQMKNFRWISGKTCNSWSNTKSALPKDMLITTNSLRLWRSNSPDGHKKAFPYSLMAFVCTLCTSSLFFIRRRAVSLAHLHVVFKKRSKVLVFLTSAERPMLPQFYGTLINPVVK